MNVAAFDRYERSTQQQQAAATTMSQLTAEACTLVPQMSDQTGMLKNDS